ncbi:Phage-related protein [Salinisphaera sp. LB1]|nr:Phage-related protein [Salinisphaera sp. LB1]
MLPGGVSELRLTVGPDYRVYYTQRGDTLIIMLCGGDKSTQTKDVERARLPAQSF